MLTKSAIPAILIALFLWGCRTPLPLPAPTVPPYPSPGSAPVSDPPSIPEGLPRENVINETNRYRVVNGLEPLVENQQLNAAADFKIRDMFYRQYSDHKAPDGTSGVAEILPRFGYRHVVAGENIERGNFRKAEDLLSIWFRYPGHRANILRASFKDIGVATGYGNFRGVMIMLSVQIFGATTI